ncbi:hypothetical protein PBRA_000732 [Plasmodiophora brassicae]|uniref:Uncharacterized protein n=1 Tax=Plasmodiophora brassicae TaxID=37360 RepID=A0A0G4IQ97_PLABS|nr:hypothetical protein PBRA_000732 [Plasmodiophora brassicae]
MNHVWPVLAVTHVPRCERTRHGARELLHPSPMVDIGPAVVQERRPTLPCAAGTSCTTSLSSSDRIKIHRGRARARHTLTGAGRSPNGADDQQVGDLLGGGRPRLFALPRVVRAAVPPATPLPVVRAPRLQRLLAVHVVPAPGRVGRRRPAARLPGLRAQVADRRRGRNARLQGVVVHRPAPAAPRPPGAAGARRPRRQGLPDVQRRAPAPDDDDAVQRVRPGPPSRAGRRALGHEVHPGRRRHAARLHRQRRAPPRRLRHRRRRPRRRRPLRIAGQRDDDPAVQGGASHGAPADTTATVVAEHSADRSRPRPGRPGRRGTPPEARRPATARRRRHRQDTTTGPLHRQQGADGGRALANTDAPIR